MECEREKISKLTTLCELAGIAIAEVAIRKLLYHLSAAPSSNASVKSTSYDIHTIANVFMNCKTWYIYVFDIETGFLDTGFSSLREICGRLFTLEHNLTLIKVRLPAAALL